MKKIFLVSLFAGLMMLNSPAFASTAKKAKASKSHKVYTISKSNDTHGKNGIVTPKSIGAGALSLIIWPGIGQLMNDGNNTEKAGVHAILGLTGIFRIWSCYDGVVDRKGGVWGNRI